MKERELKRGEKKFIETLEKIHKEKPSFLPKEEAEKRIKHTIEEIKKEIVDLPEIEKEINLHPAMPQEEIKNILSQAIALTLDKSVEEGLKFIYQTKNPYLIDAFHDLLVSHFLPLLQARQ